MHNRLTNLCFTAAALLLYALAVLLSSMRELHGLETRSEELEREYSGVLAEHELLTERLVHGPTEEELEELIRERLGFVMPGERIFYFR